MGVKTAILQDSIKPGIGNEKFYTDPERLDTRLTRKIPERTRMWIDALTEHGVAKVAMARKLAVRLYWMARREKSYPEVVRTQGSQSHPVAEVKAVPLSRPPASHP